jgi:bacillithiol biosynthesis cysteine-adding enzyme BshC
MCGLYWVLSGVASVKAQCIPFTQIPHTTRLFSDFLYDFPKVSGFYPRPPHYSDWLTEQAKAVLYDGERRQQVAGVLLRQNRGWGASEKSLANIAKFEAGALAAVTGQQVGLFGGPLFTVFKVLSAVRLAEEATAQGVPTVPVLWLATADHDLAEVNHTFLAGSDGEPERLSTPTNGTAEAPVGEIRFGEEILPIVERATALLGENETAQWLRAAYRPGETFGGAFARFYALVFASLGVIILDPDDSELQRLAGPIYAASIENAGGLNDALLERGQQLSRAGYHEQVKVTPSSTTMFAIHKGARTAIHRSRSNGDSFEVGGEKVSREALLRQIASSPEVFSPNALLRPVVQDSLLPTLVYVGGPAEVAYFAQSAVLYEKLLGRVTPILPRFSATIVDAKQVSLLERYGLSLTDVYAGPEAVLRRIAGATLPQQVRNEFDAAERDFQASLTSLRATVARLDPTLADAADRASRKIQYQLSRLRQRAANAELRRNEVLSRHAAILSNSLYPDKVPQERQFAAAQFLARYGVELLANVLENVRPDCVDHQLLLV